MSGYFLTFLLGVMPLASPPFNIENSSDGKISEICALTLTKSMAKSTLILGETCEKNYRLRRICLDAGHGGHDPGCVSGKLREKDNTLSMTLKLGKLIEENYPSVEVIYTRETDEFIDLRERAAIANRAKADLFISIHCNSTDTQSGAYGTETYTVGTHKLTSSFEVSKRENASMLLEEDYEEKYDGFDPASDEAYILFSYLHNVHLEKSKKMAQFVEDEMVTTAKRKSLGVKQAGFWVLHATAMPSILFEAGFLNHPTEGKFISSEDGQNKIVAALFEAFKRYKNAVEGNGEIAQNNKNTKLRSEQRGVKDEQSSHSRREQDREKIAEPKMYESRSEQRGVKGEQSREKIAEKIPEIPRNAEPKMYESRGEPRGAKGAQRSNVPKPTLVKNTISVTKTVTKTVAKTPTPTPKTAPEMKPNHGKIEQGVIYKVLILNTKNVLAAKDRKGGKWQDLEVETMHEKGEFWYLVGKTPQEQNAKALCSKLKNKGFTSAKVLKFRHGKLVSN